jgi:hypothetical protein
VYRSVPACFSLEEANRRVREYQELWKLAAGFTHISDKATPGDLRAARNALGDSGLWHPGDPL